MEIEPLEVYARDSNYADCVIQGDSLSILCHQVQRIAARLQQPHLTDEELLDDVEGLLHSLLGRLAHYQQVLDAHGIEPPHARRVTPEDFVKLASREDHPE